MRYCAEASRDTTDICCAWASWLSSRTRVLKTVSGGPSIDSKATVRAWPPPAENAPGRPEDEPPPSAKAAAMLKKVANCTARAALLAGAPRRTVQPHIANPRHCGRFCAAEAETVRCPNTLLTTFAAKIQQIGQSVGAAPSGREA